MIEELPKLLTDLIDQRKNELITVVSEFLHNNPETAYEEYKAHEQLTSYLKSCKDWKVETSTFGIETSFLATFEHKSTDDTRVVSFNVEYDALPGIGHGCGHNLIALNSIAAGLCTAEAMVKLDIPGTVKLFGTPAEEGGGGKVKMIQANAYAGVDVSLMCHGSNVFPGNGYIRTNASFKYEVEFFGKAAHAAVAPWEGVNALDAATLFLHACAVMRQQLPPKNLIQNVVADGGEVSNVIPKYCRLSGNIRSPTMPSLQALKKKFVDCVRGSALSSGCTFKISCKSSYANLISNMPMVHEYRKSYDSYSEVDETFKLLPMDEEKVIGDIAGSSDQGDVSWVMPAVQVCFFVDSKEKTHTPAFCEASFSDQAHEECLKSAKCLALVALKVLYDEKFYHKVKEDWEESIQNISPESDFHEFEEYISYE